MGIINNICDGVYCVDTELRITFWNKAAEGMTGYPEDDITGEIFTQKSPIVYDDSLIENLSHMAMHDQLTKVANRRMVESFLEFKLNEINRFQNKFCVVFLDIDNFRNFNNTYGHDIGDEVLIRVSESISHTVRKTDLFGRWGGEEFIGIFDVKEDNEALLLTEKLRTLIEKTEIPYGDEMLSVTVSLGATIAIDSDNIDSVVKRADDLMYKSKQNGKNRVSTDAI